MKRLIYCILLMLCLCLTTRLAVPTPAYSGQLERPANVAIINADDINDALKNKLPPFTPTPLTKTELSTVRSRMKSLPTFPPNPYSGCHARAHLVYQTLDKEIGKLFKVWLLSGSLVAPSQTGNIGFSTTNGGYTSWDYHVAAAYVDESRETWVIDTLVSSDPIPVSKWFRPFKINGFALFVRMPGKHYLYNKSEVPDNNLDPEALDDPKAPRLHYLARNVFNGNFYEYSGKAQQQHWGAEDLAADTVANFLLAGKAPGCIWSTFADQTLQLKGETLKPDTDIPQQCKPAQSLFRTEREKWVKLGL